MKVFTSQRQKTGELGESIAEKYLIGKGFSIIERNFTCRIGEIDLICKAGDRLHFVEVKTTRSTLGTLASYNPFQNVSREKLRRFSNTVFIWLEKHKVPVDVSWQIDGIGVYLDEVSKKAQVLYLEHINI